MKRKNGFKRIIAFLTALIMVFSCLLSTTVVNAEEVFSGSSTLTVSSLYGGRKFALYQIFKGDVQTVSGSSTTTLVNIAWGDSITGHESELITALKAAKLADGTDNKLSSAFSKLGDNPTAEEVATVLKEYENNSEEADVFAQIVGNVMDKITNPVSRTATTDAQENSTGGNHYAIFENIHDGYYLAAPVASAETSVSGATFSKFMLKIAGPSTVNTKTNSVPNLDKNIVTTKDGVEETSHFGNASIGEDVTFRLIGNVPGMDGFSKYFYIVKDELSEGLTFKAIKKVTINGVEIKDVDVVGEDAAQWYRVSTVTTPETEGYSSFKLVFHNFIQYNSGDDIVIDYTATLNTDAYVGKNSENINMAKVEYSNNPNFNYSGEDEPDDNDKKDPEGTIGETTWAKAYVYTTGIELLKEDAETNKRLQGAKFKITGERVKTVVLEADQYTQVDYANYPVTNSTATGTSYYKQDDDSMTKIAPADATTTAKYVKEYVKYDANGNPAINGAYYYDTKNNKVVLIADATSDGTYREDYVIYNLKDGSVSTVETSESVECVGTVGTNGQLLIEGLGEGTYKIEEITAPSGYKLLDKAITVTIKYTEPKAGAISDGCEWTFKYTDSITGDTKDAQTTSKGWLQLLVKNSMGSTLPSTGGIGTTIFYTLGSALLIGAAILLITKRRMSREEN